MKVDAFDFDLPSERIAQTPADPPEAARLLKVSEDGFENHQIADLVELCQPGDVMVVNNTRVLPARLYGLRGEARFEATLIQSLAPNRWQALVKNAKRLRLGDRVRFDDLEAKVVARDGGAVDFEFSLEGTALMEQFHHIGTMPLPPYIKRPAGGDAKDRQDYQTAFAKHDGAVAAPTASLHFTPKLIEALKVRGVAFAEVTLHVGAGTFLPVKADDTSGHEMHSEWWQVDEVAAKRINQAKRLIAVGTTSLRTLESASDASGQVKPGSGNTKLFITPGYVVKTADVLITNFHLPRSTLFMLVSAFSGLERMQAAYAHAIEQGYRFFSYGDACWLNRCP